MFKRNQRAFTLIELLVSVTIIIVLMTIGIISYQQVGYSSRNSRRQADLEIVRQALLLYKQDHGFYSASSTVTFEGLVDTLYNNDYLSQGSIVDPRDGAEYFYTATCMTTDAQSRCSRVELEARLENSDEEYYTINTL